ncbi:NUDIX domain-containing protein [Sphingomonas sp.]|jgi:predicted NUDIX family NTP pyrophosphohydrolase|uniref:NUDIX domain-containing protein n=1 Tax=Sphingomonas sp. TaxID=28214 RepID=UPI002DB60A0A|nr:NUDIX domain-containing protein [Sphingomonas sp.]HEU4968253.1 NUDIX domain-containing protein [Sphingomonas sp.]
MKRLSAGILLFRRVGRTLEVLLIRPGGPYWRKRDVGAWQIPKGAVEEGEEPLAAAFREVEEELGLRLEGEPLPLGRIRQTGGKLVEAYALEAGFDPAALVSIMFDLEWPPRSGKMQQFPEVEEARWFTVPAATEMMLPSQLPLLGRLVETLGW